MAAPVRVARVTGWLRTTCRENCTGAACGLWLQGLGGAELAARLASRRAELVAELDREAVRVACGVGRGGAGIAVLSRLLGALAGVRAAVGRRLLEGAQGAEGAAEACGACAVWRANGRARAVSSPRLPGV